MDSLQPVDFLLGRKSGRRRARLQIGRTARISSNWSSVRVGTTTVPRASRVNAFSLTSRSSASRIGVALIPNRADIGRRRRSAPGRNCPRISAWRRSE